MAANNKVIYGNDTIMDISDSTTSSNNLLSGAVGYSGTGDRVVGSLIPATPDDLDKAELNIWNLVRPPYTSEGGQLSTGITATINSDGSVTFNGTSSGDTTFWFKGDGDSIYLPKRTSDYLFKCCPDSGSVNTYCANVLVYSGGSFVPIATNTNHQGIHVSTRNADREVYVNAVIKDGTTVSDLTFDAPSILPIIPADGHVISNDSGAGLQQRRKLKFKGVYTKDTNSVDDITEVDIVREFQSKSAIEALTGEEVKGFQYLDDDVYDEFTAGDIGFDNSDTSFVGTNVQDVLEEVDTKIDSLEWKYAGTLDMASPPSGAFDWTATESDTDFVNAKEIMLMITMAISGIDYPRTTTISIVNGANSPIGVDVGFSSTGRIYALGKIKNTTQLSFIGASNGGLASKIKIYWK